MMLQSELGKQMAAVVPLPSSLSLVPDPLPINGPLTPLDTLVKTQDVALRIVDKLAEQFLESQVAGFDGALSQTQATLLIAAMKEARTSAKNRYELVHGKKLIVSATLEATALKSMSSDELAKKRDELKRRGGA
jgi:hypothetical protein